MSVPGSPDSCEFVALETGVGGDTTDEFPYDALSCLSQAKDDDSIVNVTFDSLSRVLTDVQGSSPPGATLRAKRAGRGRTSRRRAMRSEFGRPRSGGDTLHFRPSGRGPGAGRTWLAGRAEVKDVPTCNRLTKVLRDVNDPVAELATPNSETYVNKLEKGF